jgi:catechol 2,3-dioxygenase-like lactoylglutathione lyase family enzyme
MRGTDFKLNFIGVTVNDFATSFRFYTGILGMVARETKPNWALFDTTGMTLELFGGGNHSGGAEQTVIPYLHVANAESTIEELQGIGVQLDGEIGRGDGSLGAKIIAPEGLRWWIDYRPSYPFGESLKRPAVTLVDLMTGYEALEAQRNLYETVMGMPCFEGDGHWLAFGYGEDQPELLIFDDLDGGKKRPTITSLRQAPHFLSFETSNIRRAEEWLRAHDARFMRQITPHEWGGINLFVLDPDNNPVQVVQYTGK